MATAFMSVLADLHSNTLFFDPIFGGDPIFYDPNLAQPVKISCLKWFRK